MSSPQQQKPPTEGVLVDVVIEEKTITTSKKKKKDKSKRQRRKERREKDKTEDWNYSLCECCEHDSSIGFDFCIRFPCALSSLSQQFQDKKTRHKSQGSCNVCYSCCCFPCVSARLRQVAMNRYRIGGGSFAHEFLKACCCPCCSGAQIQNQIDSEKYKSKRGPKGEKMKEAVGEDSDSDASD